MSHGSDDVPGDGETMITERRKGVVLCEQCRTVYAVWIRPDGRTYPISSHNNCSCDERARVVIDKS